MAQPTWGFTLTGVVEKTHIAYWREGDPTHECKWLISLGKWEKTNLARPDEDQVFKLDKRCDIEFRAFGGYAVPGKSNNLSFTLSPMVIERPMDHLVFGSGVGEIQNLHFGAAGSGVIRNLKLNSENVDTLGFLRRQLERVPKEEHRGLYYGLFDPLGEYLYGLWQLGAKRVEYDGDNGWSISPKADQLDYGNLVGLYVRSQERAKRLWERQREQTKEMPSVVK